MKTHFLSLCRYHRWAFGVLYKTLAHLFNHGTHHRGQISAVISRLGLPVPEMDYLYYVRERE